MATPQPQLQTDSLLTWFDNDFYGWEKLVQDRWPEARLNDLGNPTGLRSYFQMDRPPGQREVARWHKSGNKGWVAP